MDGQILGMIGIGVGLVVNLLTLAFWAGSINSTIKHLSSNVRQLNIDAAVHHDKQEASLTAMWNKHDLLDKRVVVLETRCESNHDREKP